MRGDEGMKENELQEIEKRHQQASEKFDGTTMIELGHIEVPKLIAEVRRLNDFISDNYLLDKHGAFENLIRDNQSKREALEHIKEKTKHGQAYHIEGEVHYIAYRALEGEGK
jgi:hypothetical protein